MDTTRQDVRQAIRKLIQNPAFTLICVLTLALGLGANTAIFSVVNAVLLRPFAMADIDQLVHVQHTPRRGGTLPSSALDFRDIQSQNHSFSGLAAVSSTDISLTGPEGEPERLLGARITADFFRVLGVQPLLGRGLLPDEDQPGKSQVVVLGHTLWQRRFSGDPQVVGRTITLEGTPHTVVGVARREFDFPNKAQLWVPVTWEGDLLNPENRGSHWLNVYGRLKPGMTLAQASQDVSAIARELEQQHPKSNTDLGLRLIPLREELVGQVQPALLVLIGAVGMVLLITCANLANLLLARGVSREGEISVRLALGAGRGRIIRQLLTESVVLALVGAAAGVMLARWGLDLLVGMGPGDIPRLEQVAIDGPVLLFTTALALLVALLFGLIPALQGSNVGLDRALRESGAGAGGSLRGRHARAGLVVAETALAVVLLVSAGLLLKSFLKLQQVDPGFKTDRVLTLDLALPESRYPWGSPAVQSFYDTLLERVRHLPGVQHAGLAIHLPLTGSAMASPLQDLARPPPVPGQEAIVNVRLVTEGYLETLRIPVHRGRALTSQDGAVEGTRAVLINEEAARRLWPGEDPLGRRVELGVDFGNGRFGGEIVGVVGNVLHGGIKHRPTTEVYVPFAQARANAMKLTVLTDSEPLALAALVRREVQALDKDLPVANVRTMDSVLAQSVAQPRFYMVLVASFSLLALALATLGIYGVVAHSVSHRTREFGIRMALGAGRLDVVRLVVRQYLRLAGIGLLLGTVLAFVASQLLRNMLFGVERTDVLTYVAVATTLGLVALLASLVPAWRATRLDPVVALRNE
nr:ABC transporter permease [Myxococcus fulvus]